MSNLNDINERTLEQERNKLKQCCNIVKIEAVVLILVYICTTARQLINARNVGSASATIICTLVALVDVVLMIGVTSIIIGIFHDIERSDSPFVYSIADKIKGLSNLVFAGAGLHFVIFMVNELKGIFGGYVINSVDGVMGVVGLLIGVVLMAISYIFAYGCKLQQEYDETL